MGIKYHISDDGRPARCRASKRACPKGPHFLSQGEAQEYLDNNMDESIQRQKKFKQLSTNTVEQELKNKKSKTNKILELSKRKATGFNYEVFMANNYARTKNLNNVMIRNEETGKWNTSTFAEQRLSKEEAQKLYKNAARAVKEAYGADTDTKSAIKVIYYDNPESGNIFVQTGSNQTLDGISVNKNEFRIVEIKRTHKNGAQLEEHLVSIGSNGEYSIEDGRLTDEVYSAVNNRNTYDNDKDSDILKIPPQEALRQFTRDYKTRGTDELVFTDKEGKPYVIDMSQSEEDCIQDLSNAGITAQIKIRTNQSTNRMDNASIQRFKNNQNNLFSGEVDKEGNITVSQIDKNKIRETGKSKKFIRFGEFRTKFSPEEWKTLSGDTKINVKDLSYFRPILSGDIKIREGATPISRLW
jgi:hypothetical protein